MFGGDRADPCARTATDLLFTCTDCPNNVSGRGKIFCVTKIFGYEIFILRFLLLGVLLLILTMFGEYTALNRGCTVFLIVGLRPLKHLRKIAMTKHWSPCASGETTSGGE